MIFDDFNSAEEYREEMFEKYFNEKWESETLPSLDAKHFNVIFTRGDVEISQLETEDKRWEASYCDEIGIYSPYALGDTPEAALFALKEKMREFANDAQRACEAVSW